MSKSDRKIITYHSCPAKSGVKAARRYLDDLKEHGIDMAKPPNLDAELSDLMFQERSLEDKTPKKLP